MSLQKSDNEVVSTCNQPDYAALELPSKPPSEYSYAERRAELLQSIKDLGHPELINQSREAERYSVTQQQISQDLDRLAEYIDATLGDRRELVTEAVYHRAVRGLLDEEEYRAAAQTIGEWNEWIDHHRDLKELEAEIAELKDDLGGRGGGRR